MLRPIVIACTSALLASLGVTVQVVADQGRETDELNKTRAAASARVPLKEAIAVAEQQVQGKAVRAEFEKKNSSEGVYEVEVVAGTKVFDVRVDADKGTVLAADEDKADRENDDKEAD
jgi:uncharacterized membrane protein YkoI